MQKRKWIGAAFCSKLGLAWSLGGGKVRGFKKLSLYKLLYGAALGVFRSIQIEFLDLLC